MRTNEGKKGQKGTSAMETLLTATDVCQVLRIHKSTLWRWLAAGQIQSLRTPTGRLRFRQSDVEEVLEADRETEAVIA